MISVLSALVAITTALSSASIAAAKQPRITSAYTKLDWERCKIVRTGQGKHPSEDWKFRRCDGYAGIPIFWTYDDGRDDIDAGVENDAGFISGPMHSLGQTPEWRLADGKAFAIIYRVESHPAGVDHKTWSRLIVATVGEPGKAGCPIAKFDGLKPYANLAARRAADALLKGKARCIKFDE
jgi:hypothetical protein